MFWRTAVLLLAVLLLAVLAVPAMYRYLIHTTSTPGHLSLRAIRASDIDRRVRGRCTCGFDRNAAP
jgi:hypothetical protein